MCLFWLCLSLVGRFGLFRPRLVTGAETDGTPPLLPLFGGFSGFGWVVVLRSGASWVPFSVPFRAPVGFLLLADLFQACLLCF